MNNDAMANDQVLITYELIEAGKTVRGGWLREQITLLGENWPPKRGWKGRAINRRISRKDADRFVALRNGQPVGRKARRESLASAELARLRAAVLEFCRGQRWATEGWKRQPHIKPLFDYAAEVKAKKKETE